MKSRLIVAGVAAILGIAAVGPLVPSSMNLGPSQAVAETGRKPLYYRNPMGLADTSPVPKKDPMGMDYVPVYADEVQKGVVTVDAARVQRLGVKSEEARFRSFDRTLRVNGFVQADESRQSVVAPRFEGWVEKLYADTTGKKVKKGEGLFEFYSPDIQAVESEYLAALAGYPEQAAGVLERLRVLAIPAEEIDRLQKTKQIERRILMRATMDGTVIEKNAVEGMKFAPTDTLFRISDLSKLWVIANIYEGDLASVTIGQTAEITFDAYPGKIFNGRVSFVYPDIAADTRTAKLRIEVANDQDLVKTNMFGAVALRGKDQESLTIPSSALLNSGKDSYVLMDLGQGRFKPQKVKTGKEADDYIEILDGLSEEDRVVTKASFLIDAESNIRAALEDFASKEKTP
jgi:Cu(I)/Ag(I) efflux system membrane fusion protein